MAQLGRKVPTSPLGWTGWPPEWPGEVRGVVETALACPLVAMVAVGRERRLVFNAHAARAYEALAQAAPHTPLADLMPDGLLREAFSRAFAGEAVQVPAHGSDAIAVDERDPGRRLALELVLTPVRDRSGAVAAVQAIGVEAGSRLRAEAAQRESEERRRLVFDTLPVGIAIHEGPDHVCLYSNSLRNEWFGFDPTGLPISAVAERLGSADLVGKFDRVLRTGEPRVEREIVLRARAEGTGRILTRHIQPWHAASGRVAGVMVLFIDVTEQVTAQRTAQESHARLERLLDGLFVSVALLDPEGRVREANHNVLRTAGLTLERIRGRLLWELPFWAHDPVLEARVREAVETARAGGTARFDVISQLSRGRTMMADIQISPLRDETGTITDLVCSAIDIDDRVEAEARKDLLMRELQHRVKNTLATVQAVLRYTARTARSQDDLVRGMQERLAAIGRTQDGLTREGWTGRSMRAVVEAELAPYTSADSRRFAYRGDDPRLSPSASLSLGLAFHELATNAAKYGALSNGTGRVVVEVQADGDTLRRIEWRETGGPTVAAPHHAGFGSFLIQRVLGMELEAGVDMRYRSEGLICTIEWEAAGHA